jgi:hypothetical protein
MLARLESLEGDAYSADNKRLINQRLRAKVEGAIDAVVRLEDFARGVDLEYNASELFEIAATLKTWLSE